MSAAGGPAPSVLAVAVVDGRGLRSSGGIAARWADLGQRAPGAERALRILFDKKDETIRRLDATSRALIFAGEVLGIDRRWTVDERRDAALVFESRWGSLDADRRFVRSLDQPMVNGAVFPYTLPSMSLGELALRHGLRGPTLCLPIEDPDRGSALREVEAMFALGEIRRALVGSIEVLEDPPPGLEPSCRVVVAALAEEAERPTAAPWPGTGPDAFERLAQALDA